MTLTEDEKKARVAAFCKRLKDDLFFSPPEDHDFKIRRTITDAMLEAYGWGQADGAAGLDSR
jgi:hypothetical protein